MNESDFRLDAQMCPVGVKEIRNFARGPVSQVRAIEGIRCEFNKVATNHELWAWKMCVYSSFRLANAGVGVGDFDVELRCTFEDLNSLLA